MNQQTCQPEVGDCPAAQESRLPSEPASWGRRGCCPVLSLLRAGQGSIGLPEGLQGSSKELGCGCLKAKSSLRKGQPQGCRISSLKPRKTTGGLHPIQLRTDHRDQCRGGRRGPLPGPVEQCPHALPSLGAFSSLGAGDQAAVSAEKDTQALQPFSLQELGLRIWAMDEKGLLGGTWILMDVPSSVLPMAGAAQNSSLKTKRSWAKFLVLNLEQVLRIEQPPLSL